MLVVCGHRLAAREGHQARSPDEEGTTRKGEAETYVALESALEDQLFSHGDGTRRRCCGRSNGAVRKRGKGKSREGVGGLVCKTFGGCGAHNGSGYSGLERWLARQKLG